jgi:mono/diheme cytochrome c family protein
MRLTLTTPAFVLTAASFASAAAPTFNKDVAPIVFNHCTSCHRPGEIGPFPLVNFNDVKKRARQIEDVTEDKLMPPWKATEDYGHFVGERRLSKAQIDTIKAWVAGGMAEGDAKDLPAMPKFPEGWQLGEPDLVVKMNETFEIPAEGRDVYRAFVLPLNLSEDKFVRAVEFRPSNRRVTHHALFFLDGSGKARELDQRDEGPGYKSFGGPGFTPTGGLGGWAPGTQPQELPQGVARMIRKGSDLVLQMHFHPTGKIEKEQPTIGIYFTKKRPEKILAGFALLDRRLDIPAGESFIARDEFVLPIDMQVTGVTPHAHLLGRSMKAWATLPDGKIEPLIEIKAWDFDWQEQYVYRKPLDFPKGTKLSMEFTYDNSTSNPANPSNPPKRVRWGEQTTDEMAILFISGVPKNMNEMPDLVRATRGKLASSFGSDPKAAADLLRKQVLERFDKNGDGELSPEERAEAIRAAIDAKKGK